MLLGLVVCATRSHFMPLKPLSQNEPAFCFSLPQIITMRIISVISKTNLLWTL